MKKILITGGAGVLSTYRWNCEHPVPDGSVTAGMGTKTDHVALVSTAR